MFLLTSRKSNLNDRKQKVVTLPPYTHDSVRCYTPENLAHSIDYLSSKVLFDTASINSLAVALWLWGCGLWLKCDCSDLRTG
jgi:hypothetical protein